MYEDILKPKPKPLIVNGTVSYSESCRARNVIRLKKEVVKEFSDLMEKEKNIGYILEYHRNFHKLNKRIQELAENGAGVPFLLFIYADKDAAEV